MFDFSTLKVEAVVSCKHLVPMYQTTQHYMPFFLLGPQLCVVLQYIHTHTHIYTYIHTPIYIYIHTHTHTLVYINIKFCTERTLFSFFKLLYLYKTEDEWLIYH